MADLHPSLEKFAYPVFQKKYTAYRAAQIPGLIVDLASPVIQLPNTSTLHTVNHFLSPSPTDSIDPDINNPLVQHEQWMIFFQHVLSVPDADSLPFPVHDQYMLTLGKARSHIVTFFQEHKNIHRMSSPAALEKSKNALLWYDYAALQKLRVTGKFAEYRRFDIILRSILDRAASPVSNRYQFIEIPLSDRLYTRAQMIPSFRKLDSTIMRIKTDQSFFFEIHLLGMLYGRTTLLDVTPWPADVEMWKQAGIDAPVLRSTSLFDRIDRGVSDRIHLILTHGTKAIIYNLGDLQHMAETPGLFNKVLRHINTLKLASQGVTPDDLHALSDDDFDRHIDAVVQTQAPEPEADPESDTVITPTDIRHITIDDLKKMIPADGPKTGVVNPPIEPTPLHSSPAQKAPVIKSGTARLTEEKQTLQKNLDQTHPPQSSQHQRAETLYQRHLTAMIGGRTIQEHLTASSDPKIDEGRLEFLADILPDSSMETSSVVDMDKTYISSMHTKDLARTLTAFVKHGLFVSDIKETHKFTKFDRVTTYKVRMIDTDGKAHNVSFDLPHVDTHGQMMINGVTTRMVKQQVNLPICKVSEYRVNLSSNYNKTLVERTQGKAYTYSTYIVRYLNALRKAGLVTVQYGRQNVDHMILPYEYSTIGITFQSIVAGSYRFQFNYRQRFDTMDSNEIVVQVKALEKEYGVFCGYGPDESLLFWDYLDSIHQVSYTGQAISSALHFVEILDSLFAQEYTDTPDMVAEWTNLKIQDKDFPVVFVLGYRYGLSDILKSIGMITRWAPKDQKIDLALDEIKVPFVDGSLIFSRYPLEKSLVASGLLWMRTEKISLADLDTPDAYYQILTERGISINYLKGITGFFNFFIDPITYDVLQHMGEPTDTKGLLLRASSMLSTLDHYPQASMRHHRMRGYERFSGILYNEMSRQLASYQNQRQANKTYSINPQAVFQRIVQDATVMNVDVINPVHELKGVTHVTFSGAGGRLSAQSFVIDDRQYPKDGVGVMSEATPDSGKVAMTIYTTSDPRIKNIRGMFDDKLGDTAPLQPAQMLSVSGMLMPCATNDDSKRVSYINTQLSHHVPCKEGEVSRIRTGYELTLAHRTSETFSYAARANGIITDIDVEHHVVKITYEDGSIDAVSFGESYTSVSGSYLKQDVVLNVVKNEHVKRGDIVAYNSGFFTPEAGTKQVGWKHGVMANVALIEMSATLEDGCIISKELGSKLSMAPAHIRPVTIDNRTVMHDIVEIGSTVESTDILCSVEEGDLESLTLTDDLDTIAFLSSLNRKAPTAKYHGRVADISMYYACAYDLLHPSLQKFVKAQDKRHKAHAQGLEGTGRAGTYHGPGQVNVGLKYHGILFETNTVLIEFTITEDIVAGQGDKICLGLQSKTVISNSFEKNPVSESGVDVDVIFSSTSIMARIINSPYVIGIGNRTLEKMEADIVSLYFD